MAGESETRPQGLPNEAERWRLAILGLYAFFGIGYSVLMPMWEAPDEVNHYRNVLWVARNAELPPNWLNPEAMQPPLYYVLASPFLWLLDAIDPGLTKSVAPQVTRPFGSPPRFVWTDENYRFLWGPQLLRWLNVVLGAFTLLLVHSTARRLVPESESVAVAAMATVGLTPQFLHISASVSNDPLSYWAGALLLWLLSVAARAGGDGVGRGALAATLATAAAAPVFIKLTLLPVSVGVAVCVIYPYRLALRRPRILLGSAGILAVAVMGVARWAPSSVWQLMTRATYVRPDVLEDLPAAIALLAQSYWGLVGWMAVGLPEGLVSVATGIALIGLVATVRFVVPKHAWARKLILLGAVSVILTFGVASQSWRAVPWVAILLGFLFASQRGGGRSHGSSEAWGMLWVVVVATVAAVVKNFVATPYGAQGRHLFPAIGAISILVVGGWSSLAPDKVQRLLPHAVVALLVIANLSLWLVGVIPVYYQPGLG